MCGITAVVRRRTARTQPDVGDVAKALEEIAGSLPQPAIGEPETFNGLSAELKAAASALDVTNAALSGEAGLAALVGSATLADSAANSLKTLEAKIQKIELFVEKHGADLAELEAVNGALVELRDVVWSLERDRLRSAREVAELAKQFSAGPVTGAPLAALFSLQQSLSTLDRIEVRGRDSAGVHVLVRGHGLDVNSEKIRTLLENRQSDLLFRNNAVRVVDGSLSFVYKAAAEIGELGDNTASIRADVIKDELFHLAVSAETSEATIIAHTRWASVGIISEPNAHPHNSDEVDSIEGPYVTSSLNGDIDNFSDLIASDKLDLPSEITTDSKIIAPMVRRGLMNGLDLDEAFRSSVSQYEGSVAIVASSTSAPGDVQLALRGSGQGVFVGIAEDAFVVASEPYGIVEDCDLYIRMDGETVSASGSQGQIIRLDAAKAGEKAGVLRFSYDGVEVPVEDHEWQTPEVTTRDIDRGDAPHFLLKEISESPVSFRKTLRGRLIEQDGQLDVVLPAETLSELVKAKLVSGDIKHVKVIGQGTAAVAGQAIAVAITDSLFGSSVSVAPVVATELSGFSLGKDMSDTLIVAVSQSGTTTDTNRTVDLVRSRGAVVVAIVNRRGSDLVDKSDGVLYTSDGRDVEMSVASTKAFYAQIAAGFLLADTLGQLMPGVLTDQTERQKVLAGLQNLPEAMVKALAKRKEIASAATNYAPYRRYWAMVGNGPNFIAARELRIKLSELCYKSIACDVTEDKKHIDLSCEPMILVCAAGLTGSNANDVAKEVAIFRAHKAAPIVIATEGENRFVEACDVISVPEVHPRLAFILSTVIGHLFGYEAALAIDASARPLREARAVIESYVGATDDRWFDKFGKDLNPHAAKFFDSLRVGYYNGHLEASTATRLATCLRFATGALPIESYQVEFGKVGTPGTVVEDLAGALTVAIEELTRPVDAIKHQAKTVTVGISRADESLLMVDLIQKVLDTGCPRDRLSYKTLRTLAAIDPAVSDVVGYTRYRLDGDPTNGAQLHIVDKGGVASAMQSRVERDPALRGTKRRVALEREPFVSVGTDGRTVLIVPEVKDAQTIGFTLCHLTLADTVDAATARLVLQGYRNRYQQLVAVVTERQPGFRDDLLEDLTPLELLTAPVSDLSKKWNS